jgi:hypothetical protein
MYAVSRDGLVFSIRQVRRLTPKQNWDGYQRVQLYDHGKCEFVGIHRLIAETFLPNPENKPFVNHKNGDKSDNRSENLEWCTQKENIRHAWDNGLSKSHLNRLGKRVRQLTKDGRYLATWPSIMAVERVLGIAHAGVSYAIRTGRTAGGYRWEAADS